MSTPAQVEANRQNAQHSTGPRTPEGKAASAQNTTRHRFAAAPTLDVERHLLPEEDRAYFLDYHECMLRRYRPVGQVETQLVERLSVLHWRQRRLSALETHVYVRHDPQDAEQLSAMLRQLNQVGRYENTLLRLARDAEQRLECVQRDRYELAAARRRREMELAMDEGEDDYEDDDDLYDDEEEQDHRDDAPGAPASPPPSPTAAQNKPNPAPAPAPPKCVMPLVGRVASPGELAVAKLLSKKR